MKIKQKINVTMNARKKINIAALILLNFLSLTLFAHNFGEVEATFFIQEQDLLTVLKTRTMALQQKGYFQRFGVALQNQVQARIQHPEPVLGISTTTIVKTWDYDPSFTLMQPIYSSEGKILVTAGTHFNPLSSMRLDEVLLFYNADDATQVQWAKQLDQRYLGKDKLILVKGSVFSQMKQFKKSIYFDQFGQLTTRLQILHVPAIVVQDGLKLKVSEVVA